MTNLVWYQLFIAGDGKHGSPFPVDISEFPHKMIFEIAKAVYQERPKSLEHCDAADLVFYKAGTEFPSEEDEKLEPDMHVPLETTAKNPLRVVAPASAARGLNEDVLTELRQRLKDVSRMQVEIMQVFQEKNVTKDITSLSESEYGNLVVKLAKINKRYSQFEGIPGQESVLTQATVDQLAKCDKERELVAMLTPHLENIFPKDLCLVNSESYGWLKLSENHDNLRPDLFLCHEAMYTPKTPDQREIVNRGKTDKFGVLSNWELRDCLALTLEAKRNIDTTAIGQAAKYGTRIISGFKHPFDTTKLMLFDRKHFILVDASPNDHFRFQECEWTQPGSKKLLQEFPFYDNPWTVLVKDACKKWQLEIARDKDGSAFLGYGAHGRVFRVKKVGSEKHLALKVVKEGSIRFLALEKITLGETAKVCDFVMPVEEQNEDLDYALLMSYVGTPVKSDRYDDVIRLLSQLHQKNIIHGDPRLANVIQVGERLYWIDFMGIHQWPGLAAKRPRPALENDMSDLVKRILPMMPDDVLQALKLYDGSTETTETLINAVGRNMQQEHLVVT